MIREPAYSYPDTYVAELRAEIDRLQGHMRALADTGVDRDTAGIFKGLWQGSEQECEELRAEVEQLKAKIAYVRQRSQRACEIFNEFDNTRAALEDKP